MLPPPALAMTTPQDAKDKAASLLAPISAAQPGGDNASYDPEYEALRLEVTKLDSLTGGAVDWDKVVADSGAILTGKSKDYLVACYHAYALYETQKLPGLAVGLALLEGLFETYWETGFPPVKRARGRGSDAAVAVVVLDVTRPGARPLIVEERDDDESTESTVWTARVSQGTRRRGS